MDVGLSLVSILVAKAEKWGGGVEKGRRQPVSQLHNCLVREGTAFSVLIS